MEPPLWKKWLSYLFEFHIESLPSVINPHLYVSLKSGRYQLCTENAVYSFEDKYDNFKRIFDQLDLSRVEGGKVLILGFGLGSIPILLEKKKLNNIHITGVELDENVLLLAEKYGLEKIPYPIELICADTRVYMEQNRNCYNILIVDIFTDDIIPEYFRSKTFLSLCRRALTEDGTLLYNTLGATDEDKSKSEEFFFDTFSKIFPDARLADVNGNYILINRAPGKADSY